MRVFNFAAGPATLPLEVLEQVRDELTDWGGSGMSVMEVSHRSKAFVGVAERAEADLRELMAIPANYKVLFLQGGASGQFSAIPMNLTRADSTVDFVNTGNWSKKALGEARRYCKINVVADESAGNYSTVPEAAKLAASPGAAYFHYTPNETIGGVEFGYVPEVGGVPLVADLSSTILSRPLEVAKFGLIYAGAQKNIGPAGLTLVIIRQELLGMAPLTIPSMMDYALMAENGPLLNTPPTDGIHVAGLVFQWLKRQGGLEGIAAVNAEKAGILYECIDQSGGFYANPVDPDCRSRMNVPFTLADPALDAAFLAESKAAGLMGLKGYRSVGGMRASLYNAVSLQGVRVLVDFMNDFAKRNG